VQIRTATPADCEAVAALVVALARERCGPPPDGAAVLAAAEACLGDSSTLLIAEEAPDVLGYLAVHWIPFPLLAGWEGYISDLVIAEGWRGRGVGSALLTAATEQAHARGCVRLTLNNRITSDAFTRGFFTGAGFRQRTEFANFVKELHPHP
jgi:ribosomal protein S18 acetylase RimI-like enzyme